jgi:enoyl-CoA hydratase/carnithine racemase
VIVEDAARADEVVRAVDRNPIAATALAMLLRGGARRTVAEGLVAESSTYSLLQAGPEHRAWLATLARKPREPDDRSPVRVQLQGRQLHITLDRPHKRNAYNAATRDALLEALAIASSDPSIGVLVDGEGPSFCSGGDLDEFGTLADPATAHVLRLARSAARAVHQLAPRVTVRVHGACIGAGIELPAFAARVVAREDATFALPEVSMGLVPGAGGTVSIPGRVGRHRAAWLALTGQRIDAPTALEWGLVDEIA